MNIPIISTLQLLGRTFIDPTSEDPDDIITCVNERPRFLPLTELLMKLENIDDDDFSDISNNYLICANHVNDTYIAALAIYYALQGRVKNMGALISVDCFSPLISSFSGFAYAHQDDGLPSPAEDPYNPSIISVPSFSLFSPDINAASSSIPSFYTICSEGSFDDIEIPAGITSCIVIDSKKDSSVTDVLENYFFSKNFDCSNVEKEMTKLAETLESKDEYSLIAAAKQIISNHLLSSSDDRILTSSDFKGLLSTRKASKKKKKESSIIGLDSERKKLDSIINALYFNKLRKDMCISDSIPGCHLVFAGPPGTAKTTLARKFTQKLAELKIIKDETHFRECYKSDYVGQFVGQTAEKVDSLFNDMAEEGGGVLFFDEIYTISENDSTSFDKEAMTCIIQNMENYRGSVFCIFAGYEDKMNKFLSANPGMRSRISSIIKFSGYDNAALCEIFRNIARENGYKLSEPCNEVLEQFFEKLRRLRKDQFGNGREARNLFVNAVQQHVADLDLKKKPSRKMLSTIDLQDISAAADEILSSELGTPEMAHIGF